MSLGALRKSRDATRYLTLSDPWPKKEAKKGQGKFKSSTNFRGSMRKTAEPYLIHTKNVEKYKNIRAHKRLATQNSLEITLTDVNICRTFLLIFLGELMRDKDMSKNADIRTYLLAHK